jgi:hypothetical protein
MTPLQPNGGTAARHRGTRLLMVLASPRVCALLELTPCLLLASAAAALETVVIAQHSTPLLKWCRPTPQHTMIAREGRRSEMCGRGVAVRHS